MTAAVAPHAYSVAQSIAYHFMRTLRGFSFHKSTKKTVWGAHPVRRLAPFSIRKIN